MLVSLLRTKRKQTANRLGSLLQASFQIALVVTESIVNESFLRSLLLLDPYQLLELITGRHQFNLLYVEVAPDPFAEDSGDFHVRLRVVKSK